EYIMKDKRIKVFHQDNKGLSGARNTGIKNMSGKYITFVDSDDFVSDNYIQELYKLLILNDADISCVLGNKFWGENIQNTVEENEEEIKVYDKQEALKRMLYRKGVNSYAWGKL